jgi:hypothetical protein
MTLFSKPDPTSGTQAQSYKLARKKAANILGGTGGIGPRPMTSANVLLGP